ncbi:Hypothetical predicted protein [Mytilus galloprovincialis]|uniref:Reverse transcriptase domain-containing protein n=1 Tax=Mytilus galloprovincialis TaxID=29158 RepID=A0A8B6C2Z3_MYTGA|nr:Hypothetical predicted protein [Mytilus galloprovincialis]
MPRGRGIRRVRQQNPYSGIGRRQVWRNPVRENRKQRNQPKQARQEAHEPEVVPQAQILGQGQQVVTHKVGVQADNNVINGLVPKKTSGWRLITRLSYPPSNSVNDFIDPKFTSVQYSSLDNVSKLGTNVPVAKMDIKSAFRLLPCYPGD